MGVIRFDLNDIKNEPSDEALASLMQAVADEAKRKQEMARAKQKERLQKAIEATRNGWNSRLP
jgi:hypothetical protein